MAVGRPAGVGGLLCSGVASRTIVDSIEAVEGPPAGLEALEGELRSLRTRLPGAIVERYLDRIPQVGERVFVAPGAALVGDVTLAADVSIWFHSWAKRWSWATARCSTAARSAAARWWGSNPRSSMG
jgi:hypothetical protein